MIGSPRTGLVTWSLFVVIVPLILQSTTGLEMQPPPVYFINTKLQVERKAMMIKMLRHYGYSDITRVEAFTRNDLREYTETCDIDR